MAWESKSETANGARTNSLQNILGVVSAAGLKRRPPKIINPLEVYSTAADGPKDRPLRRTT
jgi:hypothetical protein